MLDRYGWSALSVRSYRVFLLGAGAANTGLFMYAALTAWAALLISGSTAGVGLVFSAFALPTLLFTAHAGGLADGFGARRTFGASAAAMGLLIALIGAAALAGVLDLGLFVALTFVLGITAALGLPASQVVVAELVPPSAVSGAVTLNFVQFSVAKIVGGVLAGLALATLPLWLTFVLAGALTASLAVPLYRLPAEFGAARSARVMGDVREGLREAWARPTIAALILLGLVPGTIAFTYLVILPVTARDVLGVGPEGLGTLLAVSGIGGLVAGLLLEPLQRRVGHGRLVVIGLAIMGSALVLLGMATDALMAGAALALIGAAFVIYPSVTITLIQAISPGTLRGRLVGFFTLLYWGSLPVGAIAAGWLADAIGPQGTLVLGGAATGLLMMLAVALRPELIRIHVGREGAPVGLPADTVMPAGLAGAVELPGAARSEGGRRG